MSMAYGVAARLGITPGENAAEVSPEQVDRFLDQSLDDAGQPGRALDLGCGRGLYAVSLAQRGWQVTGIDQVGRAIELARERAVTAGIRAEFVQGDVTALPASIGSDFDLVLDIGCFDGLMSDQRVAYGHEVDRVTKPGAKLLMLALPPGGRGPLPKGADAPAISAALPNWKITTDKPADTTSTLKPSHSQAPHVYWLTKT